ncbi:MAG: hypothetical protein COV36_03935 [Alphaproteobacteria bacterium CG11_big_fil_rev_8_21_14_0_20_44_7]|nr:MAG: hypothetical protein COV36_03935 [Alphaproteobacteria bacterium CG11_big_fil_rev_8_21_14_0_20_44_7]
MKRKLIIKLVKAAIIMLVLLALSGAGYYFMADYVEGHEKKVNQLQSEISSLNSEYRNLKERVGSAEEALEFFSKIQLSGAAEEGDYKRDTMREVLAEAKSSLDLTNILFTMGPFVESEDLKKDNAIVISSDVKVQFSALTDVMVFQFIKFLGDKLPGEIYISEFEIDKKAGISDNVLLKLSEGELSELVSGEMAFVWKGIRVVEVEKETPDNQNNNQNNEGDGGAGDAGMQI